MKETNSCFLRIVSTRQDSTKFILSITWKPEDMTSSIISPQKNDTIEFLRALYDRKSTILLLGDDSLN